MTVLASKASNQASRSVPITEGIHSGAVLTIDMTSSNWRLADAGLILRLRVGLASLSCRLATVGESEILLVAKAVGAASVN